MTSRTTRVTEMCADHKPADRRAACWNQLLFVRDEETPGVHFLLFVRHAMQDPPSRSTDHSGDLALVQAALAGSPSAAEALADRLSCVPAMVRAAHRRLGTPLDPDELDDVIQTTLSAVWRKLPTFAGRAALETWIYPFGSNELLARLAKRRARPRLLALDEAADTAGTDLDPAEVVTNEEFEAVHEKVASLGPPASDIVRMRHFDQRSWESIGAEFDIPPNTVKTHYYRALQRLRTLLAPLWREVSE